MSLASVDARTGPRKLLALDGGGIRGLMTVEFLAAGASSGWRDAAGNPGTAGEAKFTVEGPAADLVGPADHGRIDGLPSAVAVRMTCAEGLCPNPDVLDALAERAQQRAKDRDIVLRHDPSFPKPFVPRGFVKGRADRIWLPFRRFWTRVR